MQVIYERCCGLDIHKKMIMACLLLLSGGELHREMQTFGTTYQELRRLEAWLLQAGCTHIAMESTGIYWRPIYNVLEESFEQVMIVNAQHIKAVPGRKTDVKDAQWIAELLQHGLVRASFIPQRPQREVRELTRERKHLIEEKTRVVNRIQKTLEDANIKLASVVSDITGKSALKMIRALLAGQQDEKAIAALAHPRMKATPQQLEEALEGQLREHHRFILQQALKHFEDLDGQIDAFDREIARRLGVQMDSEPTDPSPSGHDGESVPSEASEQEASPQASSHPQDYRWAIEHLDAIPGISTRLAEVLVAEIGIDMSRFASEQHIASWAGVCPGNKMSAGKRLSGKTRKGNRYVRDALVEAARSAANSKKTYLGALYRRLQGRLGRKKAVLAVAHRIVVIIYHMLKKREPYREQGTQVAEERLEEARKRRAIRQLETMGYQVQLQQAESA